MTLYSDSFKIFVVHDKENFGDKIQDFILNITDEAQDNDLCRYNWKLHDRLVEETIIQL